MRRPAGRYRPRERGTARGCFEADGAKPEEQAPPAPVLLPVGDLGISVQFGTEIERGANERVRALDRLIAASELRGVVETVPSYRSLLVVFEPGQVERDTLVAGLTRLARRAGRAQARTGRRWSLPVVYEPFGEDLAEVAGLLGLSPADVVASHTRTPLLVYMLGFQPGLPNLGGLPRELHVSRRMVPRAPVPGGSVMIGGGQGAIMPLPTPSGLYMIGRTPVRLFDQRRAEPALLKAGDTIQFRPIHEAEFAGLERAAMAGDLEAGVWLETDAA